MTRVSITHTGLLCALAICCIVVYGHTVNYDFAFDDGHNITNNDHIRITALNFKALRSAATDSHITTRPVAYVTFAINYYFSQYTPGPYRIVNIIVHGINGLLVYVLMYVTMRLSPQAQRRLPAGEAMSSVCALVAGATAIVWTLHPLHTQSVTYIVQRMNSLCTLFYLAALLCYIGGRRSQRTIVAVAWFTSAMGAAVLAFATKEIAVTLAPTIILYEWLVLNHAETRWLRRNARYGVLLLLLTIGVALLYTGGAPGAWLRETYANRDFTLTQRTLTQPRVVVMYMALLLFPSGNRMNLDHYFVLSDSLLTPASTALSLLLLIAVACVAVYTLRSAPVIGFGLLWFGLNLVLESSIIGLEVVYEHRTYLPSIGIAIALTCIGAYWLPRLRYVRTACFVVVAIALATTAAQRNRIWENEVTLWSDCVAKSPNSARAHNNLGNAYHDRAQLDDAKVAFQRAIDLGLRTGYAHNNMGAIYTKQGDFSKAAAYYRAALQFYPTNPTTHHNLAGALFRSGDYAAAIESYKRTLELAPDHPAADLNLANAYINMNDLDRGFATLKDALARKPERWEAILKTAYAFSASGQRHKSIGHFQLLLDARPNADATVRMAFGRDLALAQRFDEAIQHLRVATTMEPDNVGARRLLAHATRDSGDVKTAREHYQQLLKMVPGDADAHFQLGRLASSAGDTALAQHHFETAVDNDPTHVRAAKALGSLLFTDGKRDDALTIWLAAETHADDDVSLLMNIAAAYLVAEELENAERYYHRVLTKAPTVLQAHTNMAAIMLKTQRPKQAIHHYEQMVTLRPDDQATRDRLRQLQRQMTSLHGAHKNGNETPQD